MGEVPGLGHCSPGVPTPCRPVQACSGRGRARASSLPPRSSTSTPPRPTPTCSAVSVVPPEGSQAVSPSAARADAVTGTPAHQNIPPLIRNSAHLGARGRRRGLRGAAESVRRRGGAGTGGAGDWAWPALKCGAPRPWARSPVWGTPPPPGVASTTRRILGTQ